MTPIPGPVLHIHVSGSAGTFFCELARKQNSSSKSFAGGAYACEVPCGNNHAWKRALDTTGINMNSFCTPKDETLWSDCGSVQAMMHSRGYHVVGMMETFLPEANHSHGLRTAHAALQVYKATKASEAFQARSHVFYVTPAPPKLEKHRPKRPPKRPQSVSPQTRYR